jgi:outer membrane translocation and assembly module TamA
MRVVAGLLMLPVLVAAAHAQDAKPPETIRVRSLTVISTTLPETGRQSIVAKMQGIETDAEELQERVQQALRDLGYYFAKADAPQASAIEEKQGNRWADFSVCVDPGALYTLGDVTFENARAFPLDELRRQFPARAGGRFNATGIAKGLDNLRNLYGAKGYANFGAIPKPVIDEVRHVVNLAIVIDEGRPMSFGQLSLEGVEPVAGAGKSLLTSWKEMRGKLYSPELLKTWLATHTAGWPDDAATQVHSDFRTGSGPDRAINVLLHFQ